jgi:hypothetical protein
MTGGYLPVIDPDNLARANAGADALQRRIQFQATHLDFIFQVPWITKSGKWEVTTPADGVLIYDHAVPMMDDLEKRYPVCVLQPE